MNKRAKKKAEARRRAQIHRILDLVLDINGMQASWNEETGSHPTAFLYIYGHTGKIESEIHRTGWGYNSDPKIKLEGPFCGRRPRRCECSMAEMIATLEKEKADALQREVRL